MPRAFTPEESARIRARLLDVARERLAVTGFKKTSVEAITRGAGISKGAFYLFFDKKEDLWLEVLRVAEAELRARLLEEIEAWDGSPKEGLRRLFEALFDAVTVHPLLRALADPEELAWLLRALPDGVLDAAREDDDRFFTALLRRLRRKGWVRARVPARAFVGIPVAALALVQQRGLFGEETFAAYRGLQVEAWVSYLGPA